MLINAVFFLFLNVTLVSISIAQDIPNAGMEDWTSNENYDSLNGWLSSNYVYQFIDELGLSTHPASVLKKSNAKSGSYALEVKNVVGTTVGPFPIAIDTLPGFVITSSGIVDNITTGFPVSDRPVELKGFYKFNQGGNGVFPAIDTAFISISLTRFNNSTSSSDSIGGGMMVFTKTTNNFKVFEIPIYYLPQFAGQVPDSASIFITSSIADRSFPNTSLVVDQLSFSKVTGVNTALFKEALPIPYPNPSNQDLYINNIPSEATALTIIDAYGKKMRVDEVNGELIRVNISELPVGMYVYTLSNSGGEIVYSSRFCISR